jgi:hypothetical protein
MEPATLTIAAAITALVIEASKETGKAIVKGGSELISNLVGLVRDRFQSAKVEGILTQVQEDPNEANKTIFSTILTRELSTDEDFASKITTLLEQLKSSENPATREILADIESGGVLQVKDIVIEASGKSPTSERIASNIKAKGDMMLQNISITRKTE